MADAKAGKDHDSDSDEELCECFRKYVDLSAAGKAADRNKMNSKACGKMAQDALPKEIKNLVDASVFSKHKTKGKQDMDLNKATTSEFVKDCAHEYVKMKTKNPKIPKDDPKVKEKEKEMRQNIKKGGPVVKATKISSKGNVEGLTDTKHYTGSHAQRFDESGKGKGAAGRTDKHTHTGYVGQYKDEGTYDKKKH